MNAHMRIAIVTETYVPEINGVAKTIHRLVEGLLARGHEVQLIRPRLSHEESVRRDGLDEVLVAGLEIPVYRLLRMGLPCRRALTSAWSSRRPDVVHVATEGPLGLSAIRTARRLEIPVVSGFHTDFVAFAPHYRLGFLTPLIGSYLRHVHNATDCTLVPTFGLRTRLIRDGYHDVVVVGRGIDSGSFAPDFRDRELRASWGASERDVVALHVGRLAPEKSIDLVIKSIGAMRRRIPSMRAVVVGDGPLLAEYQARYTDVIFTGALRGRELARHYASGDVFLFPSAVETFGNVVLEAMASSLAVVAFDHAAAHEYLRHGDSAFLAPVGRNDHFVELAADLAASAVLIDRFRRRALRAASGCTWDAVTEALIAAYQRVLDARAYVVRPRSVGGRIIRPVPTAVRRIPAPARA